MSEIKEGTRVRMLETKVYWRAGDIAKIVKSVCFHNIESNDVTDYAGDYWGNFHNQGNPIGVHAFEKVCLGRECNFEVLLDDDPEDTLP